MTKQSIIDTLSLNGVQREAVAYVDGPELVFAGAGTGKTRVLTAKIAHLLDIGYRPSQIFAATFTNKAAREMRERVERFVAAPVGGMWIGTFHSLCAKILRADAQHVGYDPAFTIYDTSDQLSVVKSVMADHNVDDRAMPPKSLLWAISARKSQCITPAECEAAANGFRDKEFAKLYAAYQKALAARNAMDFDDLLCNAVYMLRENETVLRKYRDRFGYVLVDEYQDTNRAQFLLVSLLSKEHQKIFAVGDDDQSIYGWRGARVENILSFEKEFANTKIFKLEENYRSTTAILNFANAAICPNKTRAKKELWTSRGKGGPVKITRFRDDRQEADYVAAQCETLRQSGSLRHIAVLFRTNAQSRVFEETFRKKRIPYILVGGTSFYERAEIKDCMAYLRLLVNPKDSVSFERIMNVPARGLGDKAREGLIALARAKNLSLLDTVLCKLAEDEIGTRSQKGFAELRETFELLKQSVEIGDTLPVILENMLRHSGYMDMLSEKAAASEEEASRIENVNELLNAMTAWQDDNPAGTLSNFLEEVSLASDIDSWDNDGDAVSFMTMHSAKGLEFKTAFIVGVEDGIIPSRQNFDDESKIEEERRLFYVGCTRAMDRLECCYADVRFRFGSVMTSEPSRFLSDIPKELYDFSSGASRFGTPNMSSISGMTNLSSSDVSRYSSSQNLSSRQPSSQYNTRPQSSPSSSRQTSQPPTARRMPKYEDFSQEAEPQYHVGRQVTHKTYGAGKIVNISGYGADTKIVVLFSDGTRRKLVAKFAKLE